ncbi:MAG: SpoIIE family protein phosphatase [Phycisphaeraceae bacterium]|nr:MAG: SpoIIE family protein phosphatase [Phycisphaeraceae bacterium]
MPSFAPNPGEAAEPTRRLRLEAIAGPPIDQIAVRPDAPVVIGRSSNVDHQLADKTVSRRHCRVLRRGSDWLLTDLESRHGTFLNGIRLEPEQPAPLNDGDLVRVGPWTLRVIDDADRSTSMPTTNDLATTSHRVQRVPVRELRSVAQQRLDLLIECAAAINAATSERDLGDKALDAVTRGTGFRRAAFIRQVSSSGDVQVISAAGPETDRLVGPDDPTHREGGEPPAPKFTFSRSLINAASNGEIVRMTGDSGVNYGESIIRLGIHAALCAPIMLGSSVEAYLYLDARDAEESIANDAAAFCQAVSRMCGLALGNLKRIEHEKKSGRLMAEIRAAREAQVRLMPKALDTVGAFEYAMQNKPGRTVAGDLFDAVPLGDGRLALFLGDVIGKGVAAAILMATAQAELRMALTHGDSADEAIRAANKSLYARSADGEFVSLWLGVLDPETETLEFVDAGHGLWFIVSPAGECRSIECEGGLVLGVKPDADYQRESVAFPRGSRLVVFSDGLLEQHNPDGEQFGLERAMAALRSSRAPRDDVVALAKAVRDHAETDALSDDLTIASVAYGG